MSSKKSSLQIDWLKLLDLNPIASKFLRKIQSSQCVFKLKTIQKKSIVGLGHQFKVPGVPKKKKKRVTILTNERKDMIVSNHIRQHLLKPSLLTQNVKFILKESARGLTKQIFKLAREKSKLSAQLASKLDYIVSQQTITTDKKSMKHIIRSYAKKLTARIVNSKNKSQLKFIGHLGYHQVIDLNFFKRCLIICLYNKTEKDIQCLMKLIKGFGDTWTTKMPSEIVEKFVNIVNENNYSEHTKNKLKKYYTRHVLAHKKS